MKHIGPKVEKNTDALLEKLAQEIRPQGAVQPLSMNKRYSLWLAMVGGVVALLAVAMAKPGLRERLGEPDFVLQMIFWILVTIAAGSCAFMLATPRWPMPRLVKGLTLTLGCAFVGYAAWLFMRMPNELSKDMSEMVCMMIVSGIGVLTALGMVLALKNRAKPTYPTLMAIMMATAGAGAGMLAIMMVCPHEEAEHVLVSHFIPALLVGLLLSRIGVRWWRW